MTDAPHHSLFDPVTVKDWSASARAAARAAAAEAAEAARSGAQHALLGASAAVNEAIAFTASRFGLLDTSLARSRAITPAVPDDAARACDAALLDLLRGRSVEDVSGTLALMRGIDAILPPGDGLKAFNLLYQLVTKAVSDATAWEQQAWIFGLDVRFAELYFDGLERCLDAPDTAPVAWRALMDRRRQPGLTAVQFALAGMSAHINRDLAVAVVGTWDDLGPPDHGRDTPEFRDYQRINDVLDSVEPGAMQLLASGLFQLVDDVSKPLDGWAAMTAIHTSRDLAFCHAGNLALLGLDSDEARAYVSALDGVAADAGRAALVCPA